jgi:ribosomal protein S21
MEPLEQALRNIARQIGEILVEVRAMKEEMTRLLEQMRTRSERAIDSKRPGKAKPLFEKPD